MVHAEGGAWITGVGVAGPLGLGWDALCAALQQPQAAFAALPETWRAQRGVPDTVIAPLATEAGAELARFETVSTDRACALALCAAQQAWAHAGLTPEPSTAEPHARRAVYVGTGMGGLHSTEAAYQRLLVEQAALRPMTVVRIMANAAAAQLAMTYRLGGPNHTYSVACASSALALGEALWALRSGRIDLALVAGTEAMLAPGVLAAWGALRVLAPRGTAPLAEACRPFGPGRQGLVMGEGAAVLVLERPEHARARGARALAELVGYGSTCDAHSLVHPHATGQIRAMQLALADAALAPGAVGAINAHATGTGAGDAVEAQALAAVFGTDAIPPVSATKSQHGHLLGAAGALEAAICVAALQQHIIPATLGSGALDPACGALDLAWGSPRPAPGLTHVMSNSFAFGGSNVALVFRRAA